MASRLKSNTCNFDHARQSLVTSADGTSITFGKLLDQQSVGVRRTLVVFIRHFFCGNCQEYVRRLSTDLAPSLLPNDISIIIVGCGAPSLISSYVALTRCPFPVYADPSTQLYKLLGMHRSLSMGHKDPAYIQHSLASGVVKSIVQGLKRIPSGDTTKGGDLSVNGGEFLFVCNERNLSWILSWSHSMLNSRDHTEIDQLKVHLNLEDGNSKYGPSETRHDLKRILTDDSLSCSDTVCGKAPINMRRSMSTRRKSWTIKGGQLARSSSIRRSVIHIS